MIQNFENVEEIYLVNVFSTNFYPFFVQAFYEEQKISFFSIEGANTMYKKLVLVFILKWSFFITIKK